MITDLSLVLRWSTTADTLNPFEAKTASQALYVKNTPPESSRSPPIQPSSLSRGPSGSGARSLFAGISCEIAREDCDVPRQILDVPSDGQLQMRDEGIRSKNTDVLAQMSRSSGRACLLYSSVTF